MQRLFYLLVYLPFYILFTTLIELVNTTLEIILLKPKLSAISLSLLLATYSQNIFSCSTSTQCSGEPQDNGLLFSCEIDYCDSKSLDYSYDWEGIKFNFDLGSGEISGKFESELFTDPSDAQCTFIRLTAVDDTIAEWDGENFTVVNSGDSTGWCQYVGGQLACPLNTEGFKTSEKFGGITYDFSNNISLKGIFDASSNTTTAPLNLQVQWKLSTSVSVEYVGSSTASTTIKFGTGNFNNFTQPGIGYSATDSTACTSPSSAFESLQGKVDSDIMNKKGMYGKDNWQCYDGACFSCSGNNCSTIPAPVIIPGVTVPSKAEVQSEVQSKKADIQEAKQNHSVLKQHLNSPEPE